VREVKRILVMCLLAVLATARAITLSVSGLVKIEAASGPDGKANGTHIV
jgi:hypothetical protein